MRFLAYIYCIILQVLPFTNAHCQNVLDINSGKQEVPIFENYAYYIDTKHTDNAEDILKRKFIVSSGKVPVYPIGTDNVWIRFTVQNSTNSDRLYLDLRYTNLSKITLYKASVQSILPLDSAGNAQPVSCDSCIVPNFTFQLNQAQNTIQTYFLNIQSVHPIIAPVYVCTSKKLNYTNSLQIIIVALFTGTLCSMLIYNLFLFFVVKDKSYLIYVLYTAAILLAQLTAGGYMYKYFWPNLSFLNSYSVVLTTGLSIITGVTFTINFLHIKVNAYKTYWLFICLIVFAILDIALIFFHYFYLSYTLVNYISILTGAVIFITSIRIARRGYSPAYSYFIAWSAIVIALILLALRNIGVLPYNNFTSNIVYVGSVLEATLLSIALADKINIFRKEKEQSQAESLRISKENERLIQQQNIILEQKITERTKALEQTLNELKDAQIQLVESEKMASLGQLTAGIAH
jgi:two-component system NtrC family sensor kinase